MLDDNEQNATEEEEEIATADYEEGEDSVKFEEVPEVPIESESKELNTFQDYIDYVQEHNKCPDCDQPLGGVQGFQGHKKHCTKIKGQFTKGYYEKHKTEMNKLKKLEAKVNKSKPKKEEVKGDQIMAINEDKPQTANKSAAVMSDAGKLRGTVMTLLKRYHRLPNDEQDKMRGDYEVLRTYRTNLRNKTITEELIEEMSDIVEDIEEEVILVEDQAKLNPKSGSALSGEEIDYEKKMMDAMKLQEQNNFKQMYHRYMEAQINNINGVSLPGVLGGNNGVNSGLVAYTTADGEEMMMPLKDFKELERLKYKHQERENIQHLKQDEKDPLVSIIYKDSNGNPHPMKVQQSVAQQYMMMNMQNQGGGGSQSELFARQQQDERHTREIAELRREMKDTGLEKKFEELQKDIHYYSNRDPIDTYVATKERLGATGLIGGDNPEMLQMKHKMAINETKLDKSLELMDRGLDRGGKRMDKLTNMAETEFTERRKAEIRGQTSEPEIEGAPPPTYPPQSGPLPSTMGQQPQQPQQQPQQQQQYQQPQPLIPQQQQQMPPGQPLPQPIQPVGMGQQPPPEEIDHSFTIEDVFIAPEPSQPPPANPPPQQPQQNTPQAPEQPPPPQQPPPATKPGYDDDMSVDDYVNDVGDGQHEQN